MIYIPKGAINTQAQDPSPPPSLKIVFLPKARP